MCPASAHVSDSNSGDASDTNSDDSLDSSSLNTDPENSSNSESTESPPAKRALLEANVCTHQCLEVKTKQIKFQHLWIINNFSYYCMDEACPNQNRVLHSSVFSSPMNDKLKMSLKLSIYDSAEQKKHKYFMNLRIHNCDREELVLKYTICILNSDGDVAKSFNSNQKLEMQNGGIFDCNEFCFFENLDIYQSENKLTPGDVLTIQCEISYDDVVDVDDSANGYRQIVLSDLQNDCARLLQSAKYTSDVELVCGKRRSEIEKFPAHMAIFGAHSQPLSCQLSASFYDKKRRINFTEFPSADADAGKVFLDCLYGQTKELYKYADKVLHIAYSKRANSLESMCEGALCFQINPESVGKLLKLADTFKLALLKSKCIQYIHCYASCVIESKNMKKLVYSRPKLCYELLNHVPETSISSWSPPTLTVDPNLSSWSYTGTRVLKCSQRWTIDKFNANYLSVEEGEYNYIESSSFPSAKSNNTSLQFSLKLYPNGVNESCKDHISLYLKLKCEEEMQIAVKVKVSIVAINENGEDRFNDKMVIDKIISKDFDDLGTLKFISHNRLKENSEQLLKDDRLVLHCEVSYIENIDKPEIKSGLNTFAEEHSIGHKLSKFYNTKHLTDGVFVIGTKKFKVHKSFVSARSEVFDQMFANINRVEIDDVDDVDAFEQILALVYGQTERLTQWAHKMLPLLDMLELNSLKHVCQLALCNQLSETNAVEHLMLADKHQASLLKSKAIEFIRIKHSVLVQNDALRVVKQDNLNLFYEVLCYKLVNLERIN